MAPNLKPQPPGPYMCTWAYGDSLVKGGGRGVDLPEILHILLDLPEFPPLFGPKLGGQWQYTGTYER